ncbi:CoA transferase [Bosea sp. LjRoot90]|uniref:CoA transferase n=1 Tax=Bosea sp. LjRoot90 TaxID=3342342 RepID=UPI003ECCEFF5
MRLLEGCRVLDLGIITAGAATAALLADFGAEVIKVESPTYRDPFRAWSAQDEPDAMPPLFRATNRNKRAISIDLKRPEGQAIFLRLVRRADVVVENFRRGVMEGLGLSFARLREANSDIILASISSQGETGPDAGHVSYGSTLEALSGLAWVTGYEGGKPEVSGRDVNYPDQIVALFAAGAIATALRSVRNGEGGSHLDLSQRDLAAFMIGDRFAAASQGEAVTRQGNAQHQCPLQDCFLAADGIWVALSVPASVLRLLSDALTAGDLDCPGALRIAVAAAIAAQPARQAVDFFLGLGVPAALVNDGNGMMSGWGETWQHALQRDEQGLIVKGFPLQVDEALLAIDRPAPQVGADTYAVLSEIAGYSRGEIAALAEAGIVESAG